MKIRPLAVAMLPPMLSVPVLANPFALSDSTNPSGTFQAISPRLTSTAISSPNGGAEHGILVSGFQKRPTAPPHGLRRTQVGGPPPRPVPCTIFATCPMFMTLVNARPSVGSCEKPFQLPPPTRARERHHGSLDAGRRERSVGVHRVGGPQLLAVGRVLGRQRVEVLRRIERVAGKRRRLDGKRLRRPRRLAGHVALRHRTLFDAEDRLAGDAIEDEDERHLGHDGDRAGIVLPLRFTSTSVGAAGRS